MKPLTTLIKLHKRRVDIIRREMVVIEEERKQLLAVAEKLREEHAREMELSTADAKMAGFFGAYSKRNRERQEKIALEVKRLDAAIEQKAEAIREEFSEQKKYEIAREHAQKRLAAVARARQQQRFDEIGTQQFLKLKDQPV
jgi:hypothetical protein